MKTESVLHPRPSGGDLPRRFSLKLSRFFWRARRRRRRRIYLIYLGSMYLRYYIIIMRMRRNYCRQFTFNRIIASCILLFIVPTPFTAK